MLNILHRKINYKELLEKLACNIENRNCMLTNWTIHVIYFSDGADSQYKNYKNMIHLCNHYNDFNLS